MHSIYLIVDYRLFMLKRRFNRNYNANITDTAPECFTKLNVG